MKVSSTIFHSTYPEYSQIKDFFPPVGPELMLTSIRINKNHDSRNVNPELHCLKKDTAGIKSSNYKV